MPTPSPSFLLVALMWFGMMAAMMLPVSIPWIRVLVSLGDAGGGMSRAVAGGGPGGRAEGAPGGARGGRGRGSAAAGRIMGRVRSGALFLAGYLSVWLMFSVAAAGVQLWASGVVPLGRDTPGAGFFLVGAGLYQLSPVKAACLRHCRNPLTWFLTRWRDGPRGALGMGWGHGLYCLGCCWALMALALVLGVMSLLWMAVLAAVVCIENLAPGGAVFGRVAGLGLVVWGVVVWVG